MRYKSRTTHSIPIGDPMVNFFGALLLLLSVSARAGDSAAIHCEKNGRNGQPGFAKVDLAFNLSKGDRDELRNISDLRGEIRAAFDKATLDSDTDAYIGEFDIKSVSENPAYRPVKYKDSSQFKEVNAKKTRGAESGMWGALIVPHDISGIFEAHYVFQAGDHMGGTIHMSCQAGR